MPIHKIEILVFGYKIKQKVASIPHPAAQGCERIDIHINHDNANEYAILTYFIFKLSKQVFM